MSCFTRASSLRPAWCAPSDDSRPFDQQQRRARLLVGVAVPFARLARGGACVGSRTPGYRAWYFASMSEKSSGGGAFSSSNAIPRRLRVSQLRRASTRRADLDQIVEVDEQRQVRGQEAALGGGLRPGLDRAHERGRVRADARREVVDQTLGGGQLGGVDVATTTPSVDSPGRRWRSSSTARDARRVARQQLLDLAGEVLVEADQRDRRRHGQRERDQPQQAAVARPPSARTGACALPGRRAARRADARAVAVLVHCPRRWVGKARTVGQVARPIVRLSRICGSMETPH